MVCLRVFLQPPIDPVQRLAGRPQRSWVDVEPVLLRHMKESQQRRRIFCENIVARYRQPLAIEDKPAEAAPLGTPAHPGEPALALLVGFEDRAEDPGQVADILGDEEIILHEPLDAAIPCMVGIAHPAGDLGLQVKGQPLFGAAGQKVQMAADRPQEALRVVETPRLLRR